MSAPYSDIRAAFVTRLNQYSGLPSVAWEGKPFAPAAGQNYIRPFLLPGEPFQAEIGTTGANRHPGVYQVSVYAPSGNGISSIMGLVNGLCDHFKRGTRLSYNSVNVVISKAYPGPMTTETDWIHVPITINYRVDAAN